jgi:hypothetical protein
LTGATSGRGCRCRASRSSAPRCPRSTSAEPAPPLLPVPAFEDDRRAVHSPLVRRGPLPEGTLRG